MDELLKDLKRCSFRETSLVAVSSVKDHKVADILKAEFRRNKKSSFKKKTVT